MKNKVFFPAIALSALLLAGCNQDKDVKLDTVEKKASYGIGLNIGRELGNEDVKMDADAIYAGIVDAMADNEPKLSME